MDRKSTRTSSFLLQAANKTLIRTFGQRSLTFRIGLRRTFSWVFVVADVSQPIVGADFLYHYGLLVDLRAKQLRDSTTSLSVVVEPFNFAQAQRCYCKSRINYRL